jgi:RNA polymerase sigma-70 factor (ECF subfamily)
MAGSAPDSLRDLIDRARGRDEEALEQLLSAHAQRLLESVRAELGERLRRRLESQDVMQQVYLDALRDIERFENRGDDAFFQWLRRIAINRICDADRRGFQAAKRRGEVRAADLGPDGSMAGLIEAIREPGARPSLAAGLGEEVALLERALGQLSEEHRRVIELRYFRQLNVAETAARMERSERAVRSLCVRALIRLRELLGDAIAPR